MEYRTTSGKKLLSGVVVIDTAQGAVSGIRCSHCNEVVSCSQFEAHAGALTLCGTHIFAAPSHAVG